MKLVSALLFVFLLLGLAHHRLGRLSYGIMSMVILVYVFYVYRTG